MLMQPSCTQKEELEIGICVYLHMPYIKHTHTFSFCREHPVRGKNPVGQNYYTIWLFSQTNTPDRIACTTTTCPSKTVWMCRWPTGQPLKGGGEGTGTRDADTVGLVLQITGPNWCFSISCTSGHGIATSQM